MIKFAIYEKDRRFLDIVRNELYKTILTNGFNAKITLLDDLNGAMRSLEQNTFDVMYISISETDDSGFRIAAKAREKSHGTIIVFGSDSETLLLKSMDYHPYNFIIKSLTDKKEQMNAELERITVMIACRFNQSRYIPVGKDMKLISQIGYLKSCGHYIEYHCTDGVHIVRENISDAEKRLCDCDFLRIHRQYIVNMAKNKHIYPTTHKLTLIRGETLPISRTNRNDIVKKYNDYRLKQSRV